jgi:hypothetical protein
MRDEVKDCFTTWFLASLSCALLWSAGAGAEVPTIEPTPVDEQPATPDPEPKDETERWVPALAVFSGVLIQRTEAGVVSSVRPAPSELPNVPPPGTPFDGDDLFVNPFVGGTVELMTPGLSFAPGRPRLFLHGDFAAQFGFERDVVKEGNPGEMPRVDSEGRPIPELAISGQGSVVTAETEQFVFSAGAGVAFTLEAWERRLRIKPSVEYIQEEIDVTGIVHRAEDTTPPPAPGDTTADRFIEMGGSGKKTYRGIGPGLEVELDTARAGPFMLTIFLNGAAYKILGDREILFTDSYTDEFGTETAAWSFEKDPWSYRAGVGLRFRWLPE